MAKRGTFGGTRFGGPGYGKAGFKRGFGRASFGRKADIGLGGGIAKDMINFFKDMQSGKFGMGGNRPEAVQEQRPARTRTPQPESITVKIPSREFLTGGGSTSFTTGQGINEAGTRPTGTPKQKPIKFRPKLTRGAR